MSNIKIDYNQWRDRLSEFTTNDMRIGTDVMLVKEGFYNLKDKPFRNDSTTCIIYIKGWVRFRLNMREYRAEAPCMIILPYDAIVETLEISNDILTRIVVMSREFTDNLFSTQANILHLHKDIMTNPVMDLSGAEDGLIRYYTMLKDLITRAPSPYRLEAVKHLTLALFYSYTSIRHTHSTEGKRERKDEIHEQFIELVSQHYKSERELTFYANQMYLTPKYLAKCVKEASGRSATEWIEQYIVTEGKALLYSTNQTIQQIADALGFQSQSLFGKYFKRVTGLSPRDYRNSIATRE